MHSDWWIWRIWHWECICCHQCLAEDRKCNHGLSPLVSRNSCTGLVPGDSRLHPQITIADWSTLSWVQVRSSSILFSSWVDNFTSWDPTGAGISAIQGVMPQYDNLVHEVRVQYVMSGTGWNDYFWTNVLSNFQRQTSCLIAVLPNVGLTWYMKLSLVWSWMLQCGPEVHAITQSYAY